MRKPILLLYNYVMNEEKCTKVLAHLLPLDTEIIKDEDYWTTETIWDLMDTIDRPHDVNDQYYLANTELMPKPDIDFFIDSIWETMDENCQNWLERNEDCLPDLQKAVQVVFDLRWDKVPNKILKMDTIVDFIELKKQTLIESD